MILLDTNVISALMRPVPERKVVEWLDQLPRQSVWTTSITVFEIRFGLGIMETGKRRTSMTAGFEHILAVILDNRIANFDAAAAQRTGDLMAVRQKAGRSGELRDTMIAGIVLASRATLATRNVRHFEDIPALVIDPWTAA